MTSPPELRRLLWLDCSAGFVVGCVALAFVEPLAELTALPRGLLLGFGAANLLYALFSFSLALRTAAPRAMIFALTAANAAWSPVCIVAALRTAEEASWLGTGYLVSEAAFVALLAALEWRAVRRAGHGRGGTAA